MKMTLLFWAETSCTNSEEMSSVGNSIGIESE